MKNDKVRSPAASIAETQAQPDASSVRVDLSGSFLVTIVSCNVTIVSEVSLMQFGSGRLDKLLH